MRNIFFLLLLVVTFPLSGQVQYNRFGYTLVNDTIVDHFFYRTTQGDTTIKGEKFTKVLIASFKQLGDKTVNTYEYEQRTNKAYTLLDAQLNTIHAITLTPGVDALGTLYGKTDTLKSGFNSTFSPVKMYRDNNAFLSKYANFYIDSNEATAVYFYRTDYTLAAYSTTVNGNKYTTYIVGDNRVILALQNKAVEEFKFDMVKGDELQLSLIGDISSIIKNITPMEAPVYTLAYAGDTTNQGQTAKIIKKNVMNNYDYYVGDRDKFIWFAMLDTAYIFIPEPDNYDDDSYILRRKPIKARLEVTNKFEALVYKPAVVDAEYNYVDNNIKDQARKGADLFTIEGIVYDTIGKEAFPVYARFSFSSYEYTSFTTSIYFPSLVSTDFSKFNDYNLFENNKKEVLQTNYLKLNGKVYGKKIEEDTTCQSHPLVKSMSISTYYADDFGGYDLAKMDSTRMADSLLAVMAMSDTAAVAAATGYSYYNAGLNYIAAINIKSPTSYSFMVYCNAPTDVYIDFFAANEDDSPARALPKKYKVVKAVAGWNSITVKGPKLKKYRNYEAALYTGTYGQFMDNDETRSFLYYENGVNNDLQRVYNYDYDY